MSKILLIDIARRVRVVRDTAWHIRKRYHSIRRRVLINKPVVSFAPIAEEAISNHRPYAAGKLGSREAAALLVAMRRRAAVAAGRIPPSYPEYVSYTLYVNSGVFPPDERTYDAFCETYLDAIGKCDALAAWDIAGEVEAFQSHGGGATLVTLRSLEPYFSNPPWTRSLEGRKVLVVSPFATSIGKQFKKRTSIWPNTGILPDFDLKLLRAPFSAGLVPPTATDWFDALAKMQSEMSGADFDVALIGAGAYSLPLAAHAKQLGKVGIHLGGSLQILFGILGGRWDAKSLFSTLRNDAWVRPSPEETPPTFRKVENGCYW